MNATTLDIKSDGKATRRAHSKAGFMRRR